MLFLGCVVWARTFMCSPRWPDFWMFTSNNGCDAGWGYSCLFPVCVWFEWPSSGVVGFYHHEPSWSCSFWLHNCLRLRSVGVGQTHARGGTLDLLMTDVPDSLRVAIVAPMGYWDHSSLSAIISMAQAVPNLCVSRKVFLKHQVTWNTVCGAIQDLPCRNIWIADNPVEVLNEHLSVPVGGYVPTKVICVRHKDEPWSDDQCKQAFGLKQ